jgi:predicted nucleotidyltransferase
LLVDIRPGISLFEYVGLQLDIQEALVVRVDLCTEKELPSEA